MCVHVMILSLLLISTTRPCYMPLMSEQHMILLTQHVAATCLCVMTPHVQEASRFSSRTSPNTSRYFKANMAPARNPHHEVHLEKLSHTTSRTWLPWACCRFRSGLQCQAHPRLSSLPAHLETEVNQSSIRPLCNHRPASSSITADGLDLQHGSLREREPAPTKLGKIPNMLRPFPSS